MLDRKLEKCPDFYGNVLCAQIFRKYVEMFEAQKAATNYRAGKICTLAAGERKIKADPSVIHDIGRFVNAGFAAPFAAGIVAHCVIPPAFYVDRLVRRT